MKNIYLIETNKSSFGKYLVINKEGKLCVWDTNVMGSQTTLPAQHIYITSDEKPRQREWSLYLGDEFKKIILTTDQDLIKDGVQAIDDEFLEWFVKNPSCEKVEVRYTVDFNSKAVIIPKEEPMSYEDFRKNAPNDLIIKFDTDCSSYSEDGNSDNYFYANCKYWESKLKEEPKQETLEEAAENYLLSVNTKVHKDLERDGYLKIGFIEGAKYQAERMYSEEDMKKCWNTAYIDALALDEETYKTYKPLFFEDFIKQFKKK